DPLEPRQPGQGDQYPPDLRQPETTHRPTGWRGQLRPHERRLPMIRAAFIGAGARSVGHMRALTYLPDVQVAAVAELDEARAQAAQERANERRAPGSDPIQAKVYRD